MKKQINRYNFEKISSRMAEKFGTIEKRLEGKYVQILLPIECNLLRANRREGTDGSYRVIEAIHICLLMIDGYLNEIEYDLDPYISDKNKPYLTALTMSFDPFTNEAIMAVVEEKCDIHSPEGLCEYFEAPVKALLRIEKSIKLWTKNKGINGYFNFLEEQIGESVTDNDTIDCVVVTWKKISGEDTLTMQDIFPDMSLQEILTELFPTISKIFELGFIPSPVEFHELTQEEYAAYQRQGGDVSKKWYTLIPKNYKYLSPSNETNLLTHEDILKLGKAAVFLYTYAKENGCDSQKSDAVLKFAAKRLPDYFTKDTRFERPSIKALEPGEIPLTEKEELSDLLAHVMGEGAALNLKVTYRDTNKTEEISIPIKKR